MKSSDLGGSNPELVPALIAAKKDMEDLSLRLHLLNKTFKDKKFSPGLIVLRKKTREEFNLAQSTYLDLCRQVPNHKTIYKMVRLGQVSSCEGGYISSLAVAGVTS